MSATGTHRERVDDAGRALAKAQFGKTDLSAGGTVAAELSTWLEERELDVAVTTLGNYRNAMNRCVIRIWVGGIYARSTNVRSTTSPACAEDRLPSHGGAESSPVGPSGLRFTAVHARTVVLTALATRRAG